MNEQEFHLTQAKQCNNKTWSILDKQEVDQNDQAEAIRLVNASYHHWLEVGEPVNLQRAEYMLSKVYNKFGLNDLAMYHANQCMNKTIELSLKDFDLAFAYEVMYRATKGIGQLEESQAIYEKAKTAGNEIADKEDRDIFFNELNRE